MILAMRLHGLAAIPLILVNVDIHVASQDKPSGTILGTVYDIYGAVIPNVRITVENTNTGEIQNLRTNEAGNYSVNVNPSRYRVVMQSSVGYPIPYTHSAFHISSNEKVMINFRPKPYSISDSIENGKWIERYEGELPSSVIHYVKLDDGTIKDLQIQYHDIRIRRNAVEYRYSVTASIDKVTIYADKVVFDRRRKTLEAEGDVTIEDGNRAYKARSVHIVVSKEPVRIDLTRDK
jgi:hypothetical protein